MYARVKFLPLSIPGMSSRNFFFTFIHHENLVEEPPPLAFFPLTPVPPPPCPQHWPRLQPVQKEKLHFYVINGRSVNVRRTRPCSPEIKKDSGERKQKNCVFFFQQEKKEESLHICFPNDDGGEIFESRARLLPPGEDVLKNSLK